jgi:hypothetical protein
MNNHLRALKTSLLVLLGIVIIAGVGYRLAQEVHQETEPVVPEQPVIAPAPEEPEETVVEEPAQEPEVRTIYVPEVRYVPQPTPPTPTHIEINEVKNESQGDINVGTLQTRNDPVTTPEPAAALPPLPVEESMTPVEIGYDILALYNLQGTVVELPNNRLKVTLSTGQEVIQDMVGEWAEKLKLTIILDAMRYAIDTAEAVLREYIEKEEEAKEKLMLELHQNPHN